MIPKFLTLPTPLQTRRVLSHAHSHQELEQFCHFSKVAPQSHHSSSIRSVAAFKDLSEPQNRLKIYLRCFMKFPKRAQSRLCVKIKLGKLMEVFVMFMLNYLASCISSSLTLIGFANISWQLVDFGGDNLVWYWHGFTYWRGIWSLIFGRF